MVWGTEQDKDIPFLVARRQILLLTPVLLLPFCLSQALLPQQDTLPAPPPPVTGLEWDPVQLPVACLSGESIIYVACPSVESQGSCCVQNKEV